MKIRAVFIGLLLGAGLASGSTLRPSMIIYGQVLDSFGIPLSPDSATVSAFLGTNEVARTTVRILPAGSNYKLEVNVSDPASAQPGEVIPGAVVTLRVRMGNAWQAMVGTNNTFAAKGNGETAKINLVLGVDSDGDGIPDDWERMVIANSGGAITSLSQIGPGTDLDGDGIPDDQEFRNGSFAFLPDDVLRMKSLTLTSNGRFSFSFVTVQGVSYWVDATPTLSNPIWKTASISLTETGQLLAGEVTGNGQSLRIYIKPAGPNHFYRLRVK